MVLSVPSIVLGTGIQWSAEEALSGEDKSGKREGDTFRRSRWKTNIGNLVGKKDI